MTVKEILEEVEKQGISVEDFGYSDFDNPLENVGEWKEVRQVGGEGEGETWYSVKFFKDHNVYIRTDGFYSSYNGTDFENGYGYQVKPTEKTITVYE
jgi:hypothetical protein